MKRIVDRSTRKMASAVAVHRGAEALQVGGARLHLLLERRALLLSRSPYSLSRSRLRTRSHSSARSTGLVRKSSAPASRPASRASRSLCAVTMMIGMLAVAGSALRMRGDLVAVHARASSRRAGSGPAGCCAIDCQRLLAARRARSWRSPRAAAAASSSRGSAARRRRSGWWRRSAQRGSATGSRQPTATRASRRVDRRVQLLVAQRLGDVGVAARRPGSSPGRPSSPSRSAR